MAQSGYTPISLYHSTTPAAVPVNTNLVNGELAINIADGKLYYKDSGGAVQLLASNATSNPVTSISFGTTGLTPSTSTSGAVTVAGTLAAVNGGTGQSSYTVGDLLFASTTTALSPLAGVATGNALISGGVGTAPSYGKIGLTTHVSGTLPVGNGGTGATTLTSGNILIGSGTSAIEASNLLTKSAAVTSGTYIKGIGYADTVVALGNTGTAINLDVVSGGVFTATLTGNATITLRYPVSSGASSFLLILTNDATPGRTVAWSGGAFRFPGGAASLTRTTTANAVDIWAFFTPDGGTTWYGNIVMANLAA